MATVRIMHPHSRGLTHGRFTKFFADTVNLLTAWNTARITRKELSRLSDRELEDIGLTRGDIRRIAAVSSAR